jgi:prevent-host-death family protein
VNTDGGSGIFIWTTDTTTAQTGSAAKSFRFAVVITCAPAFTEPQSRRVPLQSFRSQSGRLPRATPEQAADLVKPPMIFDGLAHVVPENSDERCRGARSGDLDGAFGRHGHSKRHAIPVPRKVSLAEARDHLTGLVRDVERGHRVDLTRRGKRVAVLLSAEAYDRLNKPRRDTRGMLDAVTAWRARLPSGFEGFSAEEARAWRDPSPGRDVDFG